MKKVRWLAIAIAVAFAVDFYALGFAGVSDYCMSLGYWGLIPTYAMVWGVGRYITTQDQPFALSVFIPAAWVSTSLAFIVNYNKINFAEGMPTPALFKASKNTSGRAMAASD